MTQRAKKILKIASVVLIIIFIGLLVYYFFFKQKPPKVPPIGEGELPPVTEEGVLGTKPRLIALTDEAVLGASLTNDSKINYIAWDGTVNQIDFSGENKEKLGLVAAERIGEVVFSKDGSKLALRQTLPSGQNRYLVFDAAKSILKSLPQNSIFVAFSPNTDEDRLIYGLLEGVNTRLISSNIAGSQTQTIASVKIPDLATEWTHKDFLTLKTKPSGLAYGLLYTLDLKTKKLQRVFGNVYGLTSLFSPSHTKILYSQTSDRGFDYKLAALSLNQKQSRELNIFTLPEKCVFAKDDRTLFCAAILNQEDRIMPDDYYKGLVDSDGNDIIKLNLDTRLQETVIHANTDAVDLFLSPDEAYLFFINKIDGRLYRLTL